MNSAPHVPSIEEIGLEKYLDDTKWEHNSLGYQDLVRLVRSEVNKTNLARAFNVNRSTIYKWLSVYEREVRK